MAEKKDDIKLQVGVKIFLRNPDGKYLLLHRSSKKYPDIKALWDIVGGRIHLGSSLLDNLKREVNEETSLVFSDPELIYAQDMLRIPFLHVVRLTSVGNCDGEPTLDYEHDDYSWLSMDQIKNLPEGELDTYVSDVITSGLIT